MHFLKKHNFQLAANITQEIIQVMEKNSTEWFIYILSAHITVLTYLNISDASM